MHSDDGDGESDCVIQNTRGVFSGNLSFLPPITMVNLLDVTCKRAINSSLLVRQ